MKKYLAAFALVFVLPACAPTGKAAEVRYSTTDEPTSCKLHNDQIRAEKDPSKKHALIKSLPPECV